LSDVSFLVPGGALTGPLFASLIEGDAEPALPNGTPIGHYRIEGVIGRGGSGIVYRAERSDGTFAQSVALKVVKPDPRLRHHLRRERAILAQLGHPGIARLFDGGETREGEPWFAMELVNGRRIDQWCRTTNAPWRTRLRLLGEVCDAVQYAHARLLVHRDIKPSNILVDDEGFARLLDFGISVALREPRGEEPSYAFTPEFASPEQHAGGEVTTASDVYQLGRLVSALMDPERDGRGLPDLPALARNNLLGIVKRATAQSPEARYPSAADLKSDLERVPLDEPAVGVQWRRTQRVEFFLARHAIAVGIALIFGASLVAMAAHYTYALTAQRDRAEQSAQRAQVASEVLTGLFRGGAWSSETAQQATATAMLDQGALAAVQRLADEPGQRAIAAETLGTAYVDLGVGSKARPMLEATLAALDAQAPDWARERARIELLLARIAVGERSLDETAARLGRADVLLAGIEDTAAESAELEAARIALSAQRGDTDEAQQRREELIARLDGTPLADTMLFANLLQDRATVRSLENDYAGAVADVERAHELLRKRYGAMSPQALAMERRVVWFLLHTERAPEAERILATQHELLVRAYGEDSPEFGALLTSEGLVAMEKGRREEALQKFRRALDVAREVYGPDATQTASAAHNVADQLLELGQPGEALPLYREAMRARLLRLNRNHPNILVNQLKIARCECELGQYDAAARDFAESRSGMAGRMAVGHPGLLVAASFQVDCLLRQGRVAEAAALFEREVPADARGKLRGEDATRVERVRAALEAAVVGQSAG